MSVQPVMRSGRRRYEVRWREHGRNRSRLLDRKRDAELLDGELRRAKQLGPLALERLTSETPTLDKWVEQRWMPEHGANLEQATMLRYLSAWECHIAPSLAEIPLSELTVGRLRTWQAELLAQGASPATIHKARTFLSSVLRHAAEAEAISSNPLPLVRAPKAPQRDAIRPLTPATIEAIRRSMLMVQPREVAASSAGQRSRRAYTLTGRAAHDRRRDAMIVSLLAYSGIRPGELRALRWRDVGENTLLIERAAAPDGTIKATKSRRRRPVRLLRQLAQDLRQWRLACGRPDDDAPIIAASNGRIWTKTDWENWCTRQWAPACERAGLATVPRPYTLRHSFASLLLANGRQPLYVAEQLGHSPAVLHDTYAHLFAEYADRRQVDPEGEIDLARAQAS
jgi:integrase